MGRKAKKVSAKKHPVLFKLRCPHCERRFRWSCYDPPSRDAVARCPEETCEGTMMVLTNLSAGREE